MTESKKEIITTPVPPELFHYTSISALEGILDTNTLWATRTTHLNDSSEMELIWPRITPYFIHYQEKEIRAHLKKNPGDKDKFDHAGGAAKIAELDGSMTVDRMRSGLLGHGPSRILDHHSWSHSRLIAGHLTETNITACMACLVNGGHTVTTRALH